MTFSETGERAADDEQDVAGIDLRNSCFRVLAPPCGGTEATCPSIKLQQRLLHALAGDVAGDGRVVGLCADLVDLVDVDDALCAFSTS